MNDINHWSHLVGNVFQSILGSNQERVEQIYQWVLSLIDEIPTEDPDFEDLHRKIEEYCKPYFRKE